MILAITPHGKLLSTTVCDYRLAAVYAPEPRDEPRPTRNDPPKTARLCLTTVQRQAGALCYCAY